jgi:capsular polysaccharide biosynthesis protein
VGATALVLIVSGTKYVARNDLLITASGGGFGTTSEYVYNAERLSAARAPTYAQLIQNREVLTRTSARVGQGVTPDEIQDALDVRTTRDIPIVRIAIVDSDPRRAAAIATDLAEVFSDYASELELSDGVDVSVRPANIRPEVEVDGNIVTRLALAAFFGLLVGVVAAALGERLGRRITTGRELEEMGAALAALIKSLPPSGKP